MAPPKQTVDDVEMYNYFIMKTCLNSTYLEELK